MANNIPGARTVCRRLHVVHLSNIMLQQSPVYNLQQPITLRPANQTVNLISGKRRDSRITVETLEMNHEDYK
jgi:hypothetical protein